MTTTKSIDVVPKLTGADIELGNMIVGAPAERGFSNGDDAAQALLAQFKGHARIPVYTYAPTTAGYAWANYKSNESDITGYRENPQDRGRKFLANGSCVYTDLGHIEINTQETINAFDHVAAHGAMLRLVTDAMNRANEAMPEGQKIIVQANNSDGMNSWGAHLNILLTRKCWDQIFRRRMHYLQFLASFQCCAIVLTGAGRISALPKPGTYQISARADFLGKGGIASEQTVFNRPICNTRDESLTGQRFDAHSPLARLHCIFFDSTLAQTATLLRVGMMQIITAMIEQEQVPADLLLEDPVAALHVWSRDPALHAQAALVGGPQLTAVELLRRTFAAATRFVDAGRADGLVPQVQQIMAIWNDCLTALERRDFDYLARHLDWVAKMRLLESAAQKRGLAWNTPQMRYLDHAYSILGAEGLFRAMDRAGSMQRQVTDAHIERFMHEPPEDTRAFLRGYVVRHGPELIDDIDWDMLRIREKTASYGGWADYDYLELAMDNPLGFTRRECQTVLNNAPTLLEGLKTLGLAKPQTAAPAVEVSVSTNITRVPERSALDPSGTPEKGA